MKKTEQFFNWKKNSKKKEETKTQGPREAEVREQMKNERVVALAVVTMLKKLSMDNKKWKRWQYMKD